VLGPDSRGAGGVKPVALGAGLLVMEGSNAIAPGLATIGVGDPGANLLDHKRLDCSRLGTDSGAQASLLPEAFKRDPLGPGSLGANALGANALGANALGANALGPGALGPGTLGPGVFDLDLLGPTLAALSSNRGPRADFFCFLARSKFST
jgi:hypothetical protein